MAALRRRARARRRSALVRTLNQLAAVLACALAHDGRSDVFASRVVDPQVRPKIAPDATVGWQFVGGQDAFQGNVAEREVAIVRSPRTSIMRRYSRTSQTAKLQVADFKG